MAVLLFYLALICLLFGGCAAIADALDRRDRRRRRERLRAHRQHMDTLEPKRWSYR